MHLMIFPMVNLLYPLYLKMQVSASRERVSYKALIDENSYSIVEINNAGDDPLSPCPQRAKLENQFSVATLNKVPTWMWVIRATQDAVAENNHSLRIAP